MFIFSHILFVYLSIQLKKKAVLFLALLKAYAKKKKETYSFPLSCRVSNEVGQAFINYCNSLNLSSSEALRLLVENEVMGTVHMAADQTAATETAADQIATAAAPDQSAADQIGLVEYTFHDEKGKRWLPCPGCQKWLSYSNYKRHIERAHGATDSLNYILENKIIVDSMKEKLEIETLEKAPVK